MRRWSFTVEKSGEQAHNSESVTVKMSCNIYFYPTEITTTPQLSMHCHKEMVVPLSEFESDAEGVFKRILVKLPCSISIEEMDTPGLAQHAFSLAATAVVLRVCLWAETVKPAAEIEHVRALELGASYFLHTVEIVETEDCSICLEEMVGTTVRRMACSHSFHKNCLIEWVSMTQSCPLCRFSFRDEAFLISDGFF